MHEDITLRIASYRNRCLPSGLNCQRDERGWKVTADDAEISLKFSHFHERLSITWTHVLKFEHTHKKQHRNVKFVLNRLKILPLANCSLILDNRNSYPFGLSTTRVHCANFNFQHVITNSTLIKRFNVIFWNRWFDRSWK